MRNDYGTRQPRMKKGGKVPSGDNKYPKFADGDADDKKMKKGGKVGMKKGGKC